MLCSLQLNGVFDAMKRMPWNIGDQFQMVTVSFDPLETPERARLTKQKYLELYGRAGAADGWHFLTGKEDAIKKLTEAIGFRYKYSESKRQYFHVAVTYILTPDGHLSRYLYGGRVRPANSAIVVARSRERQDRLGDPTRFFSSAFITTPRADAMGWPPPDCCRRAEE